MESWQHFCLGHLCCLVMGGKSELLGGNASANKADRDILLANKTVGRSDRSSQNAVERE